MPLPDNTTLGPAAPLDVAGDLRSLLDEVHTRAAHVAKQAGPLDGSTETYASPLATDPTDERVLASWLAEGMAELARRAPRRTLATLTAEVAAGSRVVALPPSAGRLFWAVLYDPRAGTRTALELVPREGLLGTVATTTPSKACVVEGAALYLDAPATRDARVEALASNLSPVDRGDAHGGYVIASAANDGLSLAPVPVEFRRAAVHYVLWQHYTVTAAARAGTPPGVAAGQLAAHEAGLYEQAARAAVADPNTPTVTRRPYRIF